MSNTKGSSINTKTVINTLKILPSVQRYSLIVLAGSGQSLSQPSEMLPDPFICELFSVSKKARYQQ